MKCIHCQLDSKLKDRTGGICPGCKHPFAFEPTQGDRYTDMFVQKAIERVSAGAKVWWTEPHLYYELIRPRKTAARLLTFISLFALGFAVFVAMLGVGSLIPFFLVVSAMLGIAAFVTWTASRKTLSREDFRKLLERFTTIHGRPQTLIVPAPSRPPPSQALEAELSAYSFDRAVICDHRSVVDVLLANQFHFENNCAILGADGYPEGTFAIAMKMLKQNPRLNIFVLHDATPSGCRLARMVATSREWFEGIGRVVDVGLRPAHAKYFPGMAIRNETRISVERSQSIGEEEAQWLEEWRLELAVVRPEQLIKRLYKAIAGVEGGTWDDTSTGVVYFGEDAGTSDGGGDSFG